LRPDFNPLVEALINHPMLHIEAYVFYVDKVLCNKVAYKLIPNFIKALIKYHKDIDCANATADIYNWFVKDQIAQQLHQDFVQAINRFVSRTHISVLEGLEEDGIGELFDGKSEKVKNNRYFRIHGASAFS
jgi:hypothetical protein